MFNFKAIGYALLWQSYWLPVLLIVAHDQWLQVRELQPPDHRQQLPQAAPPVTQAQTPLASVLAGEPLAAESLSVDSLPVVAADLRPQTAAQTTAAGATAVHATAAGATAAYATAFQDKAFQDKALQDTPSQLSAAQVTALPRGQGPLGRALLVATSQPLRGQARSAQARLPQLLAAQVPAFRLGASRRPLALPLGQGGTSLRSQLQAGRPILPLVSGVDRNSPVLRQFSGSELLGGTLTLRQSNQEAMSPLARAEQARLAQTADPLAPVPARWREPMRRELHQLGAARLSKARVVHVPSERITHTVVLPLAMQHDGSIDALVAKDPAVSDRDLSDWASRQATPAQGSVQPVVLHLHPLPKSAVTAKATPPAPAPGPAAADQPVQEGAQPGSSLP